MLKIGDRVIMQHMGTPRTGIIDRFYFGNRYEELNERVVVIALDDTKEMVHKFLRNVQPAEDLNDKSDPNRTFRTYKRIRGER